MFMSEFSLMIIHTSLDPYGRVDCASTAKSSLWRSRGVHEGERCGYKLGTQIFKSLGS